MSRGSRMGRAGQGDPPAVAEGSAYRNCGELESLRLATAPPPQLLHHHAPHLPGAPALGGLGVMPKYRQSASLCTTESQGAPAPRMPSMLFFAGVKMIVNFRKFRATVSLVKPEGQLTRIRQQAKVVGGSYMLL